MAMLFSSKTLNKEIETQVRYFLSWIPGGIGSRMRYYYYKKRFQNLGRGVNLSVGCIIRGEKRISLGEGVGLGVFCQLYAGSGNGDEYIEIGDHTLTNSNVMINADINGEIIIGENVIIGPNVVLRASNHFYEKKNVLIKNQGHRSGRIIVGDDVWFGANAVILPNVQIGTGAVIGAGSVVTKDVPAYSIVAGVPSQKIGNRQLKNTGDSEA